MKIRLLMNGKHLTDYRLVRSSDGWELSPHQPKYAAIEHQLMLPKWEWRRLLKAKRSDTIDSDMGHVEIDPALQGNPLPLMRINSRAYEGLTIGIG